MSSSKKKTKKKTNPSEKDIQRSQKKEQRQKKRLEKEAERQDMVDPDWHNIIDKLADSVTQFQQLQSRLYELRREQKSVEQRIAEVEQELKSL